MKILLNNRTCYNIDKYKKIMNSIAKKVVEKENINPNFEISLSFVTNDEIKKLNKKFRNINKETDVLSFPFINFKDGEKLPQNKIYLLGDIIISLEKSFSQAKEYDHSIEREISFLFTHAILHLLGYDHIKLEDEKIMFSKQEEILNEINIIK